MRQAATMNSAPERAQRLHKCYVYLLSLTSDEDKNTGKGTDGRAVTDKHKHLGGANMKYEQQIYETVEAGTYPAIVTNVEEADGSWGKYVKITFELQDEKHAGVTVTGIASAKFSSRSKLYRWVKAIFDAAIPRDYSLDTDHLVGRECRLRLSVEETEDGTFNHVEKVLTAKDDDSELWEPEDKTKPPF